MFRPKSFVRPINFCGQVLLEILDDLHFGKEFIWTDEVKFYQQRIIKRSTFFCTMKSASYFGNRQTVPIQNQRVLSVMNDRIENFLYDLISDRYVQIKIIRNVFMNFFPFNQNFDCFHLMEGAPVHSSKGLDQQSSSSLDDRLLWQHGSIIMDSTIAGFNTFQILFMETNKKKFMKVTKNKI